MRVSAICIAAVFTCVTAPLFAANRLHVIERAINDVPVDVGPKGDSIGDMLVFKNPVYDADDKVELGTVEGVCFRVEVGKLWECQSTFLLTDGMITVRGRFADVDQKLSRLVITAEPASIWVPGADDHGRSRQEGLPMASRPPTTCFWT